MSRLPVNYVVDEILKLLLIYERVQEQDKIRMIVHAERSPHVLPILPAERGLFPQTQLVCMFPHDGEPLFIHLIFRFSSQVPRV